MPNHLGWVPLAELLANSSFSTKLLKKIMVLIIIILDYSLTRSAELKLSALKNKTSSLLEAIHIRRQMILVLQNQFG